MNTKLRQAVNAALESLQATDEATYQQLRTAVQRESRDQALEDATKNGWNLDLERPAGERVNPKVFAGKTIYNAWMDREGITVLFQDFTKYVIQDFNYGNIKRLQ